MAPLIFFLCIQGRPRVSWGDAPKTLVICLILLVKLEAAQHFLVSLEGHHGLVNFLAWLVHSFMFCVSCSLALWFSLGLCSGTWASCCMVECPELRSQTQCRVSVACGLEGDIHIPDCDSRAFSHRSRLNWDKGKGKSTVNLSCFGIQGKFFPFLFGIRELVMYHSVSPSTLCI